MNLETGNGIDFRSENSEIRNGICNDYRNDIWKSENVSNYEVMLRIIETLVKNYGNNNGKDEDDSRGDFGNVCRSGIQDMNSPLF